jgi:ketosteroid isomerase-like protein
MEDEILLMEQSAMERWRKGDPMGWEELSTDDIIYIEPGLTQPIIGLEQYQKYLELLKGKFSYQSSEFIDPKVVTLGDAAVLTYNYRSSGITNAALGNDSILWNATEVYFRGEEQWRIVHTHWSFVGERLPARLEIPLPVLMTAQDYEGVLGELIRLESAAMLRWRKGDPSGFIELYAPNVTYFDVGTPQRITGYEAMHSAMASLSGKIFYDVQDFIDPQIRQMGDLAVLVYRFLSTRLNADGSISSRVPWNCTEVYARHGGTWRILHNHWSFIRGERV